MTDHSRHPLHRAIQQSMESIAQIVVYNEVKYKLLSKELITMEDVDEYDRLTNIEAVLKVTRKVMRSIAGCQEFLKILQEMSQQQYTELATIITNKCDQNGHSTPEGTNVAQYTAMSLQQPICSQYHTLSQEQVNSALQMIPQAEVDEMLEEGKTLIDTLLRQEGKMSQIIKTMQLKRNAGKSFTEFLMYIIKLFQKAIENKTITLTNSTRQSIVGELNDSFLILYRVRRDFCDTADDATSLDDSIALVVTRAIKVKDVIKNLQKKHWLQWCRSAKNISTLVPIFEKIIQVIKGIKCINCRPFRELFGDVAALKVCLGDIEKRVFALETVGLSATILFAIGGVTCLIVGGILLFSPAAPAAVPFVISGVAGIGVSLATGSGTELCTYLAMKRLNQSKAKGERKGGRFVKEDTLELSVMLKN